MEIGEHDSVASVNLSIFSPKLSDMQEICGNVEFKISKTMPQYDMMWIRS